MLLLISDAFDASLPTLLEAFGEVTEDKKRVSEADVILVRSKTKCTPEYIDSAKNLKLIVRGGVGLDNIDLEYAAKKGIIVRNTPKASSIAVAELTFALMLSVPNHLIEVHNGMKRHEWMKSTKRTELYGKTLALLGMGNIAAMVAVRAAAFGMKIVAYDKYVTSSPLAEMKKSIEEAVKDADYISMHLPLTDETKGIMCTNIIQHCTKSPVVINTGRGACIDAESMKKALDDGTISHYATDVYPSDPPSEDYPLIDSEHVTLSPHIGANTIENLLRIGDEVVSIIKELKQGGAI